LTLHERQLASLVDDIARIEAVSYEGVGVEKIYLHEGADVTRAVSQLASSALVVLKYMPPNITPPLVLRYGATDVPIIQLSLSSKSLPDTKLNDLGQNIIRPALAVVHGAEVPYPYGGKPRVIMADLDSQALQARGLSASDVSSALQRQNVILPAGDVKIGDTDYSLAMNNSPDVIEAINAFPIAGRRSNRLHARRRARARRLPGADEFRFGQRHAGRADDDSQDRRRLDARGHRRRARCAAGHPEGAAERRAGQGLFDQSCS
jgi:multidrug efflux pump subunit AcrB